jgi:pimeloyl-ACP methyl ester carboxylesterase
VRAIRILGIALAVVAGLIAIGHCSGNQPRLDAVDVVRRELGIEVDARKIDVGDVELFVVSAGPPNGPPVVLLHGFPEFWYAWKDAIAPLNRAGFRVIIPDQRGYGDSDKPRDVESYDVDRLGDDIAGLITALGYESALVVAQDWGGAVAWNLAIRHPERVLKLAVIDTSHPDARLRSGAKQDSISWYRTFFQTPFLPEESSRWGNWFALSKMLRATAKPGAFPDEKLDLYRSAWDRDGAFGTMVNWYRAAFRGDRPTTGQRRVSLPVLLILAGNDAFIPADLTRASLDLCDDAKLVELGSGTHWVMQEEPERIAQLLISFFAGKENPP